METKTFEVRDIGTFVPVLAMRLDPTCEADLFLLSRGGFGKIPETYVLMMILSGTCECKHNPHHWGGRTMPTAHREIRDRWDELVSGQVINVEFILGETKEPKVSERFA